MYHAEYVKLEDSNLAQAPLRWKHVWTVCCGFLSVGVLIVSCQILSVTPQEGAVNLAAISQGALSKGRQQLGSNTRLSRVPGLSREHSVAARTAVVAPPTIGVTEKSGDPLGRDVVEQLQQQIAQQQRKKEGWAKREGLSLEEYFKDVKNPADLAQAPPFSLKDVHASVPKHLWKKDGWKSMAYFGRDILEVLFLGVAATKTASLMPVWAAALTVWPLYALLQGVSMWGLFCVGHDCGHQSFSNNQRLNDFIGLIAHSSILVPYHPWRISHRKHHANHGHVENDESWTPMTQSTYDTLDNGGKVGRFGCPVPLLAYPIYLATGAPGKGGAHYDPNNARLFQPKEKKLVVESNIWNLGMVGLLAAAAFKFGALAVLKYYFAPWLVYIMLLDSVTYLHHHGHHDDDHPMPWYRGDEWTYMRGGLTCLDRDFGILNHLHHDIGTHVIHHLFPQMPHYNLQAATQHMKKMLGPYYREPEPCPGLKINGGYNKGGISLGLPVHLLGPLFRSFRNDHYVEDKGDVLFYKRRPADANATGFNGWLQRTCGA